MRLSTHQKEQERWRRRTSKSAEVQAMRAGMVPVECVGGFEGARCLYCGLSTFNEKLHKTKDYGWIHAVCSKGQFVLMSGAGWHINQLPVSNIPNIVEKEYDESMVKRIPPDRSVEKPDKWRTKRKRSRKGKRK